MNDKRYLDHDGLKNYDALIKEYIDKRIAEAITHYESEDETEIEDYGDEDLPEIQEYMPD